MGSKTASRVAGVKLSAIVAAFLLPILVLGYFLSTQINREIVSTRRALDGAAFNRLVMPILLNAAGGRSKQPDNDVLLVQGPALAHGMGLDGQFEALRGALAKTEPGAVMDAAMDLTVQSAGKTGLGIDSTPESYFLAAIVADSLPEVLRDYQQTAAFVAATAGNPADGAARDAILISLGKLGGSVDRVRRGLESARLAGHGDDYDRAIQNTGEVSDTISHIEQMLRSGGAVAGVRTYLGDKVPSRMKRVWLVTISRRGQALEQRNNELGRTLTMIMVLSAAACVMGLGAAAIMFLSTLRKLDEVEAAKEQAVKARDEADQMSERLSEINNDIAELNSELQANMQKLRDAQEEIVRKGRLSQLGQLTATVAHELRNPLGAVRASIFLLERKIKSGGSNIEQQVERINKGVARCDGIITQLLDFSRTKALECDYRDLDGWLAKLIEEEAEKLPNAVAIECDLGLDGRAMRFDPSRLSRVIINLLSNASEALVGRGDDSTKFACADPLIRVATRATQRGIEIWVSDNGPGIPDDVKSQILEPLFTTKSFGTGLGLPAVEKILQQHGARLEIMSKPGKGACFIAIFPHASAAA